MPSKVTRSQGKSMFVKEVLNDDPLANAAAVNEAWRAAGMAGGISATLVSKIRSRMGQGGTPGGRRRRSIKTTGTRRGRPHIQVRAGENGTVPVKARGRMGHLMELEVEIDRLLMKVVEIGTLSEVETALRKARRHLYAGLVARS